MCCGHVTSRHLSPCHRHVKTQSDFASCVGKVGVLSILLLRGRPVIIQLRVCRMAGSADYPEQPGGQQSRAAPHAFGSCLDREPDLLHACAPNKANPLPHPPASMAA